MGPCRGGTDRGYPNYLAEGLSKRHFVRHICYIDWPGIEPGSPW